MPGPTYGGFAYGSQPYAGAPVVGGGPNVTVNGGLYPQEIIEIAPGYGPFAANPVWVDITTDVTEWRTKRGKQHELGRFEPGTVTLTIDNRGGAYYPFTAGTYAGKLNPGMPIRVRGVYSGVVRPVFAGFADTFHVKWRSSNESDVEIIGTDLLKLLNLKKAPTGAWVGKYSAAVLADAPFAYYHLSDPQGSTTAADASGNGYTLTKRDVLDKDPTQTAYVPTYYFQAPGTIIGDPDPAFYLGKNAEVALWGWNLYTRTLPQPLSIEGWCNFTSNGSGNVQDIVYLAPASASDAFEIRADTNGYAHARLVQGANSAFVTSSVLLLGTGWHHVVATLSGAATPVLTLYVDGVNVGSATATGAITSSYLGHVIGGSWGGSVPLANFNASGSVDEVALYPSVLTAAQILNHYNLGAAPYAGQTGGQRIATLASIVGVPAANQALDAGSTPLQGMTLDLFRTTMLANAQAAADTEGGYLFADAAGNLTFYDRNQPSGSPNGLPAVTLGDSGTIGAGGESPYLVQSVELVRDTIDLFNEVVVTPRNLAPQTVLDATSQGAYGASTLKRDNTLHSSAGDAAAQAGFLLGHYKTPKDRVRAVQFTPVSDPNVLFPAALGFELLTRVNFKRRPPDATATVLSQDALIEGIEHKVTAKGEWTTTWHLSTVDATPMIWTIEDPVAGQIVENAAVGIGQ